MDDDCEFHDGECPHCGHELLRSRCCQNWACEDGMIDEHHDDPINYAPGSFEHICPDCCGTGIEIWCSGCGYDVTRHRYETHDAGGGSP